MCIEQDSGTVRLRVCLSRHRRIRKRLVPNQRQCIAGQCSLEPLWERLGVLAKISESGRGLVFCLGVIGARAVNGYSSHRSRGLLCRRP